MATSISVGGTAWSSGEATGLSSEEIERGLYQHASIVEAGVVGVPDDAAGVRIIAYLSVRPPKRPSIIEMKSFCAGHLPSYMSPDVFRFMEALPRTSTDKVDYQSLTRLAEAGVPQLKG